MNWLLVATAIVGVGLWWLTGHWQSVVTFLVVILLGSQAYLAVNQKHRWELTPWDSHPLPPSPLVERIADSAGWVVIATGLTVWTWTGQWRLAAIGGGVGFVTLIGTTALQVHRARKSVDAADGMIEHAKALRTPNKKDHGIG